jgi:hypothetical protein
MSNFAAVVMSDLTSVNEWFARYYSEAVGRRKKKNKKGCFHSPFFPNDRP